METLKRIDSHISDPRLAKLKLNLKPKTHTCYKLMLKVIKKISKNNCNNLTDNDWDFIIPNKLTQIGCKIADKKYWKNSFYKLVVLYLEVIHFFINFIKNKNLLNSYH